MVTVGVAWSIDGPLFGLRYVERGSMGVGPRGWLIGNAVRWVVCRWVMDWHAVMFGVVGVQQV